MSAEGTTCIIKKQFDEASITEKAIVSWIGAIVIVMGVRCAISIGKAIAK